MDKLIIKFEHCYGIKKLYTEFDFAENGPVFSVYAPNGMMKTSFANTFSDLAKGENPSDRIQPVNITICEVKEENGNDILPENIFVIEPYNEKYRSERISTLLVNDDLRKKYENIHKDIDEKTESLISVLKKPTGLKSEIKEEFSDAITHDRSDFFRALGRVRLEVEQEGDTPLGDVKYSDIFNSKTDAILSDPKFLEKVKEYIEKYDELVSHSTFFRKGVFTHNNATDIAKTLKDNGFFKAEHSVFLRINGEKSEISSEKDLVAAIETEKDRILTDKDLKSAFEAIDKQLTKNADLKQFRSCLENHQIVMAELDNPERLRQKLWIAYLIRAKEPYTELMDSYEKGKEAIAEIVQEAKCEITRWASVIGIFNERFSVPFVVRMDNQEDVILRSNAPVIRFDFLEDSADKNSKSVPIEEDNLLKILSNGEKRALYILNIIFEVEARKEARQNTLFIVDDIADSFDYKNKYAIIEYIKDIADEVIFQQIILSHNFDFHRTVSGRLNLKRENRILAEKVGGNICLEKEIYQNSAPFAHWRKNFANESMLIASIPFLRNLAEFCGDDTSYNRLTSLLHFKPDTDQFTVLDFQSVIKQVLRDQNNLVLSNPGDPLKNLIYKVADSIAGSSLETAALEEKIVLSIAIRLRAEEFMIGEINDHAFWEGIKKNQTINLIKRYKTDYSAETEKISLVEQVNLMTPENIHLNSFMYEPILDLSAQHLKKLYSRVSALGNG